MVNNNTLKDLTQTVLTALAATLLLASCAPKSQTSSMDLASSDIVTNDGSNISEALKTNGPDVAALAENPFNKWSAHHRPIGDDAVAGVPGGTSDISVANPVYSAPGPINSRGRLDMVGTFRIGSESKVFLDVTTNDPYKIIRETKSHKILTPSPGLRFPNSPLLPSSGDAIVMLYPRNGLSTDMMDVFSQFRKDGYTATKRSYYPLSISDVYDNRTYPRSPGASAIRIPSGVLRGKEINGSAPAPIYHALNATATRHSADGATPDIHVLSRKMVWPAYGIDQYKIAPTGKNTNYDNQGDLPYGTLLFIRKSDYHLRESLNLNARQKILFDTFAFYGCRLVDGQGGTKNGKAILQLRTDGELNGDAEDDVNQLLGKILKYLYPLRNPRPHNRETEINSADGLPYAGGGGPIDPAKSKNNAWDNK